MEQEPLQYYDAIYEAIYLFGLLRDSKYNAMLLCAEHSGPKWKKTSCTLCFICIYRLREEPFFIRYVEGVLSDIGEDAWPRKGMA